MKRILAIGVPVILLWLACLAWLADREGWWRTAPTATTALPTSAFDRVLNVLAGDDVIGRVTLNRTPHADGSVSSSMASRLALPVFGTTAGLEIDAELWRPPDGNEGTSVDLTVRAEGQEMRLDGVVEGGRLRGAAITAGERIPFDLPLGKDLLLASGVGPLTDLPLLEAGDVATVDALDPISLRPAPLRLRGLGREALRIGDETVSTRRVEIERRKQSLATVWIGDDGGWLRAETALGLTFEVAAAHDPLPASEVGASAIAALSRAITVDPVGRIPRRGATTLTVAIRGVPGLAEDARQTALGDGRWRITSVPESSTVTASGDAPVGDRLETLLGADPFVQSNHPRIRRHARTLTDFDDSLLERARSIYDWTFEAIEKVPTASLPSALAVLDDLRGDCNEHTVLFTALARAMRVPTRIAVGLVWSEDLGAFGYHAWPEVWTGDAWLAMDPTLGQPRADATHMKLLDGSVLAWQEILAYLGRIEIEVLEVG